MTTYQQAITEHGTAKRAVYEVLRDLFNEGNGFRDVADWVLANAAAIHAHQSAKQPDSLEARVKALEKNGGLRKRVQTLEWKEASSDARLEELARRIEALEDAPGPRPNEAEVSALRVRMDALTETLEKMRSLDTSDVLAALVRDVALLKDALRFLADTKATSKSDIEAMEGFIRDSFGTVPQTPEARAWVDGR